jgi:hypothetical protein
MTEVEQRVTIARDYLVGAWFGGTMRSLEYENAPLFGHPDSARTATESGETGAACCGDRDRRGEFGGG